MQSGMLQHTLKAPALKQCGRSQGKTRQHRLSLGPSLSAGAFKTMTLPGPDPTETTRLQLVNEGWGIVAHLSAMTVAHGDLGEPWGGSRCPHFGFVTGCGLPLLSSCTALVLSSHWCTALRSCHCCPHLPAASGACSLHVTSGKVLT